MIPFQGFKLLKIKELSARRAPVESIVGAASVIVDNRLKLAFKG